MGTKRWSRRLQQGTFGLVFGLLIAEGLFWWRDDGAFPHVNFYVPDPVLGVRLAPGAKERLAFGGNSTTSIATNADGFRTHATTDDGAWPAPHENDVLVVGDSQVFGLGVEVDETFSSRLAVHSGRTVLNAGIPTYGPQEYAAVIDEVLQRRKVKRVIFVVNLANDLFELSHPNRDRHVVWDGWAVRKETAPVELPTGALRRWLFSQSHLVFAARAAAWRGTVGERRSDSEILERGSRSTPSEGHWRDLLNESVEVRLRQADAERKAADTTQAVVEAREQARQRLFELERKIVERLPGDAFPFISPIEIDDQFIDEATAFAMRRGQPDDILVNDNVESGRSIRMTATALLAAATMKQKTWDVAVATAKTKQDSSLLALLREHEAAQRDLDRAVSGKNDEAETTPTRSRLAQVLSRVKGRCDESGAKLLVVALPLDVMVSPHEWGKYGEEPLEMAPTRILIDEVLRDATDVGAIGVDVTSALAGAEPGAFLQRDLHMSAQGHDAVARVLRPLLDAVPAVARPRPGLPEGRSYVPAPEDWAAVTETTVKGSSDAGCETKQIREWLKVACLPKGGRTPTGVEVVRGGEGDAHALFAQQSAVLLAPVLRGKQVHARFFWRQQTQDLTIEWPTTAEHPTLAFGEPTAATTATHPPLPVALQLDLCQGFDLDTRYCGNMYGALDDGCDPGPANAREYGPGFCNPKIPAASASDSASPPPSVLPRWRCRELCLRAQPEALPRCRDDAAPVFATQRCRTLCDMDHPCGVDEICVPWQGSGACLPRALVSP
jgi:hypothetical protein